MLYVVATPIGNLEDITLRALRILKEADVIIAEDTRHTGILLKHFNIPHKPMVALYDEVEAQKVPEILKLVQDDTKAVLVSDAGTPLISDPGYKLVREAIKNGVKVVTLFGGFENLRSPLWEQTFISLFAENLLRYMKKFGRELHLWRLPNLLSPEENL